MTPNASAELASSQHERAAQLVAKFEALLEGGAGTGAAKKKVTPASQKGGRTSRASGSRRRKQDELDELDELENDQTPDGSLLRLEVQPSFITGGELREYQLAGLNWLLEMHQKGLNPILADEMGLGKTVQSISLLACVSFMPREMCSEIAPHLVVVPLTVLGNWARELKFWCPKLTVLKLHGNKEERYDQVRKLKEADFDVCITTYETVGLESSALRKVKWNVLVVDEAHRLKNETSQLSILLRKVSVCRRLLLTGTPIQNNLHELWALLNFLYPEIFTASEDFGTIDANVLDDSLVQHLHRLLHGCLLRRLKADVEKGLPPKKETKLFVKLTSVQADWYKRVLLRDLEALSGGRSVGSTSLQNVVVHLRKVCNHPYLFEGAEPGPPFVEGEHLVANSGKMLIMDKLLRRLKDGGHRVLLFVTMTRMLDILEDYCAYRGWTWCRLDGSTSSADREAMMSEYNRPGSETFLFMLSTRAGGLGINLYTADTVILYDSDWNPQVDLQAQDRAHRIGQKRPVNVYRLIHEDTLEEKIVERAERKLFLDRLIIEQGRLAMMMPSLQTGELQQMIRFGADVIIKSEGTSLTDADIDVIISQGESRTKEIAAKLKADVQHSLANYKIDSGDQAKLYELDGVEYDAKGVKDLISKLKAAKTQRDGATSPSGSYSPEQLVQTLLLTHWGMLRHLRVCAEPGMTSSGLTMHHYVKQKLEEIEKERRAAVMCSEAAAPQAAGTDAYYTVDKKEVAERHWENVCEILAHFGMLTSESHRTVSIPLEVCQTFEERVVAPWQAAWRTFRASQRGGRGTSGLDDEIETGGPSEAVEEAKEEVGGDTLFQWGCLDWVSTQTKAADKNNVRSAFIVSVPDLVDFPEEHPLVEACIAQVASGGRHNLVRTKEGTVFAWGRGTTGCLGVGAIGCSGRPILLRALELGGKVIVSISCGAEHSALLTQEAEVYTFGSSKRGQLGLDHADNVSLPVRVPLGSKSSKKLARSVVCGAYHTLVVLRDGNLLSCGASDQGALGQGTGKSDVDEQLRSSDCMVLAQAAVFSEKCPASVAAAGGTHNLVLGRNGQLYVFGAGSWGRLGLGGDNRDKDVPTRVQAAAHLGGNLAVAAGWEHSLLLTNDGSLFQWGRQGASYISSPTQVPGIGPSCRVPVRSICAGRGFSMAIDHKGGVWVWGNMSASGALGLGQKDGVKLKNARQPTNIDSLKGRNVVQISAGWNHVVALADSSSSEVSKKNMVVPGEVRFGATNEDFYDDAVCDACLQPEDKLKALIFCDLCNKAYHLQCHEPPLQDTPEGDWMCYNCCVERFSQCFVCGMQDELTATLALCDTGEGCRRYGACHIECMPVGRRPKLKLDLSQLEEGESKEEAGCERMDVDSPGVEESNGGRDEVKAPAKADSKELMVSKERKDKGGKKEEKKPLSKTVGPPKPKIKSGITAFESKREWNVSDFYWYCPACEAEGKGAPASAGDDRLESCVNRLNSDASAPSCAAVGTEGHVPLLPAQRALLKQYYDLCASPDAQQLRLLGALTERSDVDVRSWFQQHGYHLRQKKMAAAAPKAYQALPEHSNGSVARQHDEKMEEKLKRDIPYILGMQDPYRKAGNDAFVEKKFNKALRLYAHALTFDPYRLSPIAHVLSSNLAAAHASMANDDERAAARARAEGDEQRAQVLYASANDSWKLSLEQARRSVAIMPSFAKAHSRSANALRHLGFLEEAAAAYSTTIQLDPGNVQARDALQEIQKSMASGGAIAGSRKEHTGACGKRAMNDAAVHQPETKRIASVPRVGKQDGPVQTAGTSNEGQCEAASSQLLQKEGNAAHRNQDYGKAVVCFSNAIDLAQNAGSVPVQLFSNRSASYCELKRFEEALKDADKSISMQPQWSRGYSRRGNALHGMGRMKDAVAAYRKALELDPENEIVRQSLKNCGVDVPSNMRST